MITSISSDLPTFKQLKFHEGLNILLVEKSKESTEQHTRNRAGKTSFIEIVHFILGSKCPPESIFRNDILKDHEFSMTFDLESEPITIGRKGESHNDFRIIDGNTEKWLITPYEDKSKKSLFINKENWLKVLGTMVYNVPPDVIENEKYPPKFRAMFAYSARRENNHAFSDPITQSRHQQIFDWQLSISYILGIDWNLAREWQIVRDREKTIRELKKAIKQGAFGDVLEKSAYIRTKLTIAENKTNELREQIRSFKVLDEYKELEKEASSLTEKINYLTDQNVIDRELINELKESLQREEPPSIEALEEVYKEAGVALPEIALRRFEDIKTFHETIIENRSEYLSGEIQEAEHRLEKREMAKKEFSKRRTEIMSILSEHGALEQYSAIRTELSRAEANVEELRKRLSSTEQLERQTTELEFERTGLLTRLRQNFHEQKKDIDRAILIFEEI
ncbi:MAG: DUF2326 domain-containing protein, partial [Candidatus Thermoplasmatota archaeon]|nr:DUF2326 domain-containing protein [Candidatus Thermoplasmatota archaeon]